MQILGLPGRNPATFDWLSRLLDSLAIGGESKTVIRYDCWDSPGTELDLEAEASKARDLEADLVVAKSIGTLVALAAFPIASTERFVMIGTPLRIYTGAELDALNSLAQTGRVLMVQQTHDRTGSMADLKQALRGIRSDRFFEVPGQDHGYGDVAELKRGIEAWHARLAGAIS